MKLLTHKGDEKYTYAYNSSGCKINHLFQDTTMGKPQFLLLRRFSKTVVLIVCSSELERVPYYYIRFTTLTLN